MLRDPTPYVELQISNLFSYQCRTLFAKHISYASALIGIVTYAYVGWRQMIYSGAVELMQAGPNCEHYGPPKVKKKETREQ